MGILITSANTFSSLADTHFDLANGQLNTIDGETYYITGSTEENSLHNININGGTVRLVLNNVNMNLSDWVEAISIHSGANVTIILEGENTITTGWGITVTYGSTLNIAGEGKLNVLARNSSAIGNVLYDSRGMGNINIQSGTLDLKSEYGCGIGSAVSKDGLGKVGNITISGGHIKAVGSAECAGIGSGESNTLGDIYIGGDSVVEASSIEGAGIGTGTTGDNIAEYFGSISIGGNAEVNAVSYSGAGIGTGDKQDKAVEIKIGDEAKVYAESFRANSIGNGAETKTANSTVNIENTTDVTCVSYRSDTLPDGSSAPMAEVKMQSAPISDITLSLVDAEGNENKIAVPKDCYTVAKTVSDGVEYTILADTGKNINEAAKVNVNNYTKEEISLKNTGKYTYVSEFGDDTNDGLSAEKPVKTFEKAYQLVDSNGCIIICNGSIEIDRVPNLDKNVRVESKDNKYTYSKLNPTVSLNSSTRKVYDSITFGKIKVISSGNYISSEVYSNIRFDGTKIIREYKHNIPKIKYDYNIDSAYIDSKDNTFKYIDYLSRIYDCSGIHTIASMVKESN